MNENKKKARPDGDASEQAKQENHHTSGNSHNDFITGKGPISRYLSEGQENGLHLQDLVRITGWTEREVRQQIHRERCQHIPILSNNRDGYFLPGNPQERASCVHSMRHRAGQILAAAKAIEGDVQHIEGQVSMVWPVPEANEDEQTENAIPKEAL